MAKTDMERMGIFSEMGYTTIKDPYSSRNSKPFNESASKGHQMLTISTKSKTAHQDGYFSDKFNRVMEGEAYSDMVKLRRQNRVKASKKNLGGAYVPPSVAKKGSGVGSYYGTLGGSIKALSAATKPAPKYRAPGRNFYSSPPKKGTGYGYGNVTIGDLPKYHTEPYDRARDMRLKEEKAARNKLKGGAFKLNSHPRSLFEDNPYRSDKSFPSAKDPVAQMDTLKPFKPTNPSKKDGGCKAGTFDPYPKHLDEPYRTSNGRKTGKLLAGVFKPPPSIKSTPTISVINQNVDRKMNITNFQSATAT